MIKIITINQLFSQEDGLFQKYSDEAKVPQAPDMAPDINHYLALEDNDALTVAGLYIDDKLQGFCTLVYFYLSHSDSLGASVDMFFIDSCHRGYGTGKKLISFAEDLARDKGAKIVTMTAPLNSRLEKVACSFGYEATNIIHTKAL